MAAAIVAVGSVRCVLRPARYTRAHPPFQPQATHLVDAAGDRRSVVYCKYSNLFVQVVPHRAPRSKFQPVQNRSGLLTFCT